MEPLPLKDIHLPDSVAFWPPAPGWWLLAVLLPLLIFLCRYFYKRIRRQTAAKTAAKLLSAIRRDSGADARQTLAALSALLRRVAISTAPRSDVASLRGEAWLSYLDQFLPDAPFSQGPGRCLADGHYRQTPPADAELEALFELCERWLKQQAKKP
ncbi:DUF4381 domain-containing protein [Methylomonas methanica]|uniref:DUF4381 domain-containing protein n=1 Tax=Methylomonas methanica TaxID=421 RepID=A0A177MAX2_METMH|nr:DUF4381 domain-containing protein [Methylomonas methanica]OAI02897.1 hypothetical protein A1332_03095 [Methylomonas methanica]